MAEGVATVVHRVIHNLSPNTTKHTYTGYIGAPYDRGARPHGAHAPVAPREFIAPTTNESCSDEKARKTAEIGHIERDGAWDPAVAAGSDGLSLCDDSCEAVSGEASVKRVLGLGGVFRGGRTVERSPAYQPCLLLAPGPACVAAAPRVAPPCLQSTLCNPLLRATPSTRESWASV